MSFSERLLTVMAEGRDLTAIEFDGSHVRWSAIAEAHADIKTHLDESGVDRSGPVAIVLRNRPSGVAALLSVLAAHRCATLISAIQPINAVARDVHALAAPVLIADRADWDETLTMAAKGIGAVGLRIWMDGSKFALDYAHGLSRLRATYVYRPPENAAIIVPTSGTTGPPKRIPLSWKDLATKIPMPARPVAQGRGVIVANPLVTITGLNILLPAVVRPLTLALMERLDLDKWADLVALHKPAKAGLPPAAMKMMLDKAISPEKLRSITAWVTGSAPLDPALALAFETRYEMPVLTSYGATEFGGAIALWSIADKQRYGESKQGSSGRALAGVQLRVIDPVSGEKAPPGEQGILEIKKDGGIPGGETGWVRTTDLARLDGDGFLFIDGRADDVIIRGGFKVPLLEVESVLRRHPAIRDAATIGMPDERLGQVPIAIVVRSDGKSVEERDLTKWVHDHLAPYMVPVRIIFVDALPLNASLKVDRPALRLLAA